MLVFGDAKLVEFVGFDDENRSESPVSTVNIQKSSVLGVRGGLRLRFLPIW